MNQELSDETTHQPPKDFSTDTADDDVMSLTRAEIWILYISMLVLMVCFFWGFWDLAKLVFRSLKWMVGL